MMSASGPHDALPPNCGRGATMGPSGCSAQSSPVVFRGCCCVRLQGLCSSWHDWRRHAASLIRKRSQVRVLDRPLPGNPCTGRVSGEAGSRRYAPSGRKWPDLVAPSWPHGRRSARSEAVVGPRGSRALAVNMLACEQADTRLSPIAETQRYGGQGHVRYRVKGSPARSQAIIPPRLNASYPVIVRG